MERLPRFCTILYFVSIFLCIHQQVFAQPDTASPNFFVRHYSQEDGMVGPDGHLLLKDSRGFLWIGGFQGISRFDGHSFTNFTKKDGLLDNSISDIREDADGLIYAATATGIYRFTGAANHLFVPYHLPISIQSINKICPIDSSRIYVSNNREKCIFLYDGRHMQEVKGFSAETMRIELDKDGFLYVLTPNHELFVIKDLQVVKKIAEPVTQIFPDGQYFGSWLQKNKDGRIVYNGQARWLLQGNPPFLSSYHPTTTDSVYYNYTISSLYAHTSATIHYRNAAKQWQPIQQKFEGVSFNSELLVNDDGSLDFITNNGLYILYPQLYKTSKVDALLNYFSSDLTGKRFLHNDSALYKNPLAVKYFHTVKKNLRNIYVDRSGTVWYCGGGGIYYLSKDAKILKYYNTPYNNQFKNALEDNNGRVWFETYGGIVCYDGKKFSYWAYETGIELAIYSTAIDRHGIYYSAGQGICAFVNGAPIYIGNQLGIDHQIILSLALDKERNLWACTNDYKLLKIDVTNKNIFFVSDSILLETNGKPFTAQSIVFDSSNNLWVASYNQLAIYVNQTNGHFTNTGKLVFGKEQQLRYITLNRTTLSVDEDGANIYLRHDSLFGIFNEEYILNNYHSKTPLVHFTGIQLFKKDIEMVKLGIKADKYGLPINPVFTSKQNSLSFFFTGIVSAEQQIAYKYKLDGFDNDWQSTEQVAEASYTNLPPGNYTFYVKAANVNGVWSAPLGFGFTILLPWYLTTWLLVLWTLMFVSILWLFFRLVKRSLKKKEYMERLLVEQKLKALRAQLNPHFLQNTFNFLSQSLKTLPTEHIEIIIDRLSSYLRNVLDLTDETVVTLEDELEFAEEYLTVNQLIFPDRFRFSFNISETLDTYNTILPSLFLQPLLENAIKHGIRHIDKGIPEIVVSINNDKDFVIFVIANTYSSLNVSDYKTEYKPKGLLISEQRLALLFKDKKKPVSISASCTAEMYEVKIKIPL